MSKWSWERWRRAGKRLGRDERRGHPTLRGGKAELIEESEHWREQRRQQQGKQT